MTKVGMVGLGRLGLPVAVCLAQKYRVFGHDVNPALMTKRKYEYREAGIEPGTDFQPLFDKADLHFGSLEEVFTQCDPVFLCIQTPHQPQFEGTTPLTVERADFDYSYLEACARQVAPLVRHDQTVSVISTVLPGTMQEVVVPHLGGKCNLVYNPFFPAMGTCCSDFMNPEFILLGGTERATLAMAEFYRDFYGIRLITEHRPILTMSYESAELSKVAYNCFISAKIAIANCLMEIAHKTPGCHVDDVTKTLSCATRRLLSPKYLTAGMGDGGGCFPPGQLVMTIDGPRQIETISPGDLVLSGDGQFHPVVKRWERDYSGDLIRVRVVGMPSVLATDNHNFYAAVDTRSSYQTTMRGKLSTRRTGEPISSSLTMPEKVQAGDLDDRHWVPWPVSKAVIERPDDVTDDYCLLLGWYLSEGHADLTPNSTNTGYRRGRLSFCLHKNEMQIAQELSNVLLKLTPPRKNLRGANAKPTISFGNGNGITLRYGSIALADRLRRDGGSNAFDKRLPKWALWGDEKTVCLVLEGLLRGDGHLNQQRITYSTVSYQLAYGVLMMLERIGIGACLRVIEPRVSKKGQKHARSYEVRTGNILDVNRLCRKVSIGMIPDRSQPKKYIRMPVIEGNRYRQVRNVERIPYQGKVYNLWVDETHNYVTPAGLVANCHPRDGIAMSWLSDQLDLSYDLFGTMMEAREAQTEWLADLIASYWVTTRLRPVLLGKSFKPESNITTGSPAILLANILKERGITPFDHYDPYDMGDEQYLSKFWFDGPRLFFIACKHQCYQNWVFPTGSVVLDPHRYIKKQPGVEVVHIGVGR